MKRYKYLIIGGGMTVDAARELMASPGPHTAEKLKAWTREILNPAGHERRR